VQERGERGWRRSWQDLVHAWLGFPSSLSSSQKFEQGWAGVVLGVVLAILHGIGCLVLEGKALLRKEKKRKEILT
jgi:diacylglycerol kinase